MGAGAGLLASVPIPGLSSVASGALMGFTGAFAGNVLGQRIMAPDHCGGFDWETDIDWLRASVSGAFGLVGGGMGIGVGEEGNLSLGVLVTSAITGIADATLPSQFHGPVPAAR